MFVAMKSLEGQVALITGADGAVGRAVALALSARGVRVIVTGREEAAVARTVGEVVYGGGKARHLAGDVREASHRDACFARARDVFGEAGLLVVCDDLGAECMLDECIGAKCSVRAAIVLTTRRSGTLARKIAEVSDAMRKRNASSACNAIAIEDNSVASDDSFVDEVAALVTLLCTTAGAIITGRTFRIDG